MNGNLLHYSLSSSALVAAIWAGGVLVFGILMVALSPSFEGIDYLGIIEEMPEAMQIAILGSMGTLSEFETSAYLSFVAVEYFSSFLPVMLGLYPLFSMGGTLAREAERGTLGPLLAQPVSRWRVVTTKYFAFALSATVVVVAAALGLVVGEILVGIETPLDRGGLLQIYVHLLLFLLALGAMALAFSALFMAAGKAWGATGLVLFLSFLFNMMGGFEGIAQAPKYLSLLYYWRPQDLLVNPTLMLEPMLVYAGVAVVAFIAALAIFQRREIPG